MTHLSPPIAKSASPSPRGIGLGVEGCPLTKPRPGPAPGPRGQAQDAFTPLSALTLAALLLAAPAAAQVIPTGTPAVDILLSRAISEQRIFHSCSAFDLPSHALVVSLWATDAAAAAKVLTENNVTPEAIAAFTAAAATSALMPAFDTPFEDVKQLCDSNPDWQTRWTSAQDTLLSAQLPMAFQ